LINKQIALRLIHLNFLCFYIFHVLFFVAKLFNTDPNEVAHLLEYSILFLVFLLCYYLFIYLQIIGVLKKSISADFLIKLKDSGTAADRNFFMEHAGDGTGYQFIIKDRLEQMTFLGLAVLKNDNFEITKRGTVVNNIVTLFLKFIGIKRV